MKRKQGYGGIKRVMPGNYVYEIYAFYMFLYAFYVLFMRVSNFFYNGKGS